MRSDEPRSATARRAGSSFLTPLMMLCDAGVAMNVNRWLSACQLTVRSTSGSARIGFSSDANAMPPSISV